MVQLWLEVVCLLEEDFAQRIVLVYVILTIEENILLLFTTITIRAKLLSRRKELLSYSFFHIRQQSSLK